MNLIKNIKKAAGCSTYRLARNVGISPSLMDYYLNRGTGVRLDLLCRLRKTAGLSWVQLGKLLDDEFLNR